MRVLRLRPRAWGLLSLTCSRLKCSSTSHTKGWKEEAHNKFQFWTDNLLLFLMSCQYNTKLFTWSGSVLSFSSMDKSLGLSCPSTCRGIIITCYFCGKNLQTPRTPGHFLVTALWTQWHNTEMVQRKTQGMEDRRNRKLWCYPAAAFRMCTLQAKF